MPPRTKNANVKRKRTNDGETESPSKFHSGYFTNPVDSKNFKDIFSIRNLTPTFTLDIKWFRSQKGFDFIDLLEKQKLLNFLTIKGSAAPNFVKAFYTTLSYDHDSDILSAELKGTKISLTLARFSEISHLPCDGDKLVQKGHKDSVMTCRPAAWTSFDYQEAYASICHPLADSKVRPVLANSLSTRMRLLLYTISRNILPKAHNCATVNYEEALLLWGIKNEKKINWANLVVGHMLKCKMSNGRDLPYAVLITKILRHCDIPFLGERTVKEDKACHVFGATTIGQMRLELVGETWQNKAVGPASAMEYDPTSPQSDLILSASTNSSLENPPASSSSPASLDQIAATLNTIKAMCESNQKEIMLSREIHSKELTCLTNHVIALEKRLESIQSSSSAV